MTPGRSLLLTVVGISGLFALALAATLESNLAVTVTMYLIGDSLVLLDSTDFALRLYWRRRLRQRGTIDTAEYAQRPTPRASFAGMVESPRPFAIGVSVYNAASEIDDFLTWMEPYRDRLWIIDDASTDDTAARVRLRGFRCIAGDRNRHKPGAIAELVRRLPETIESVLVLDPDIRILNTEDAQLPSLEQVVLEFQRGGAAALCPRITVRDDGILGALQGLEYWLSFELGRASLGRHGITSGAALYRRDRLAEALASHTLSVYAEDLENAMILLAQGEAVIYDGRLVLETAGKRSWRGWFSQRVGWAFGLLRVYTERLPEIRRAARGGWMATYQYLVYTAGLCILLQPLRVVVVAILTASFTAGLLGIVGGADPPGLDPRIFLAAYVGYTLLALLALLLVVRRRRWRLLPALPLYFFYAAIQILPITVGYLNWVTVRLFGRRVFRDHYLSDDGAMAHLMRHRRGLV